MMILLFGRDSRIVQQAFDSSTHFNSQINRPFVYRFLLMCLDSRLRMFEAWPTLLVFGGGFVFHFTGDVPR